jgi:hypothetical protein
VAITLKQLIQNRKLLAQMESEQQRCPYCGVVLQETITGKRPTPKGEACSDCYYEQLGEAVEQNPIVSGRVGRG